MEVVECPGFRSGHFYLKEECMKKMDLLQLGFLCLVIGVVGGICFGATADEDPLIRQEVPNYVTDKMLENAGIKRSAHVPEIPKEVEEAEEETTPPPAPTPAPTPSNRVSAALAADGVLASKCALVVAQWGKNLSDAQVYELSLAVARECRQRNLKAHVVLGLIKQESNYNPNVTSHTNDYGLMQLHGKAVFDIRQNISLGCDELEWRLKGKGGDYRSALAGYNGGTYPPPVSWAYADKVLGYASQASVIMEGGP